VGAVEDALQLTIKALRMPHTDMMHVLKSYSCFYQR